MTKGQRGKSIGGSRSCYAVHSKKRKEQPAGKVNWVQRARAGEVVAVAVVVEVARMRHDLSHWKIEGAGGVGTSMGTGSQLQAGRIKQVAGGQTGQAKRPSDGPPAGCVLPLGGDGQLGRIGKRGATHECVCGFECGSGCVGVVSCVCELQQA